MRPILAPGWWENTLLSRATPPPPRLPWPTGAARALFFSYALPSLHAFHIYCGRAYWAAVATMASPNSTQSCDESLGVLCLAVVQCALCTGGVLSPAPAPSLYLAGPVPVPTLNIYFNCAWGARDG